jgi:hypothetical protein
MAIENGEDGGDIDIPRSDLSTQFPNPTTEIYVKQKQKDYFSEVTQKRTRVLTRHLL